MALILRRYTSADVFEEDPFGPSERFRFQQARENVWWRRHLRWIARWPWPLRLIILLFEVTIAYAALIFGMMLGVGLRAFY